MSRDRFHNFKSHVYTTQLIYDTKFIKAIIENLMLYGDRKFSAARLSVCLALLAVGVPLLALHCVGSCYKSRKLGKNDLG